MASPIVLRECSKKPYCTRKGFHKYPMKSTSQPKARVGFIGAGEFISYQHLYNVSHNPRAIIRAICDLDDKRLASHQSQYKPDYTTKDHRRILDDKDVDIVIIGTKQDLHAKFIVEALDAGKWVMCEKPMAETDEETEKVLAAEKRAKGRLAIGFNRRFAPAYARAKRLLSTQKPPIYINYRLMFPSPQKEVGFYANKERILYEGTHIFDYICWLLDEKPTSVYMTGDSIKNNVCVMEFPKGSRISFICGSMGSYLYWKEYMEIFTEFSSIAISEFIDMRVRGIAGEFDAFYPVHLDQHAKEIREHGLDFYEVRKSQEMEKMVRDLGMTYEKVIRPNKDFGPQKFDPNAVSLLAPDKGWRQSSEHFIECFLTGQKPENADGAAGALSTNVALCALESMKTGHPVPFKG